jgi:regulator of cell morphogenesis and NO signaling
MRQEKTMSVELVATVRDIAMEFPQAVRVFESFGIDYCCGGGQSLEEACRRANVSVTKVREALERPPEAEEHGGADWTAASLEELTDHIVTRHHTFVRRETARLAELLGKVAAKHQTNHPELNRLEQLFQALASELKLHMMKEEQVLFPMIRQLEEASREEDADTAAFAGIMFPIERMISEHEDAGGVLRDIRSLTGSFQPPADACPSFRALYQGLEEFERDLHRHIHLENNILFPGARRMVGLAEPRR